MRLVVSLRLLVTASHYHMRARSCCDLLCLLLNRQISRHSCLTHSMLHPFLTLDELRNLLFLVDHRFEESRVELVLLLQLSLVLLHSQVLL